MRQLVLNSYWVKTQYSRPDAQTGVNVTTLYDEIGYPLTVQNVTTKPGLLSPIHNHGTWGVIFQIRGEERHTFWRRVNPAEKPLQIEPVGEHLLGPGEILSLHPDAIHQVETVGQKISLTFQFYGDTQPKSRFQFEPETQTARRF
ncbi:cupin [Synechococcus sp. PCC 7336]|uniref:cysteine dioxygenase family protein n=1 Tax=Synechococcus sp. PCC 7336 TaxID=195250 RepID=UPI001D0CF65F|nr:cupin [Synechococcus sp. PCC 7336]